MALMRCMDNNRWKRPFIYILCALFICVIAYVVWNTNDSSPADSHTGLKELAKHLNRYKHQQYFHDFKDGLAAVERNGRWGFVNKAGKEAIPCKYEEAWDFSEGLAAVKLNGKWGFINTAGKVVIPCIYDDVSNFSEGLSIASRPGLFWGFINTKGEELISCTKYKTISAFSEGLSLVQRDGQWGYMNKNGEEVMPCHYEHRPYDFSEGVAVTGEEELFHSPLMLIDKENKVFSIPGTYCTTRNPMFKNGLLGVAIMGTDSLDIRYGFINKGGEIIIPYEYEDARNFSEGLAAVRLNDKWGYINTEGKMIVPCIYDWAWDFKEGAAAVKLDGKCGFINAQGQLAVPTKYEYASSFSEGLARVRLNGKEGYVDQNGNDTF